MVAILMMSTKLATLDFLEINTCWNKDYEIKISVHDITNKILSRDSDYIVYVVMWPKFGNSNISVREGIITYIELTKKSNFFKECSWFIFSKLGLAGMAFKFKPLWQKG